MRDQRATNAHTKAMLPVLAGIPIYAFLKARRERLGDILEPVDDEKAAGSDDVG